MTKSKKDEKQAEKQIEIKDFPLLLHISQMRGFMYSGGSSVEELSKEEESCFGLILENMHALNSSSRTVILLELLASEIMLSALKWKQVGIYDTIIDLLDKTETPSYDSAMSQIRAGELDRDNVRVVEKGKVSGLSTEKLSDEAIAMISGIGAKDDDPDSSLN